MKIDRVSVTQKLIDATVIQDDGCGLFISAGVASEVVDAVLNIAKLAAEQALQGLEIMVTDQGVNVIKDGVLVAFQAHSAPRAQDVAAQSLIAGDRATNGGLRSRMSLCPQCGDKRCPRAEHHASVCQKATG